MKGIALAAIAAIFLAGCNDADIASSNLSKAADNFEINRRIVFYNGITGEYMLSIEGLCALGTRQATCMLIYSWIRSKKMGGSEGVCATLFWSATMSDETAISLREAAQRLGLSYQTVFARRHEIGFRIPGCRKWCVWPSRLEEISRPQYKAIRLALRSTKDSTCRSNSAVRSGGLMSQH